MVLNIKDIKAVLHKQYTKTKPTLIMQPFLEQSIKATLCKKQYTLLFRR